MHYEHRTKLLCLLNRESIQLRLQSNVVNDINYRNDVIRSFKGRKNSFLLRRVHYRYCHHYGTFYLMYSTPPDYTSLPSVYGISNMRDWWAILRELVSWVYLGRFMLLLCRWFPHFAWIHKVFRAEGNTIYWECNVNEMLIIKSTMIRTTSY